MNKKIKSFSTIVILLCLIFSLPAFAETVKYEYDGLHRLTRVERDKTIIIYEYDDLGNRTSMVVILKHDTPTALFLASPIIGIHPLTVSFTDQSTGDISSWSWSFGDGGTSVERNPTHTYNSAGTYTLNLAVTGPGGSNTKIIPDYILVQEDSDTDKDGLLNDDEINIYGTDPNNPDTDGDGINDGDEVEFWGPNWNIDYDNDEIINLLDPDSDNDGFSDGAEKDQGFDPGDPKSKPGMFSLETGEVSVDHNWKRVNLTDSFIDPVVVAKPLSYNETDPAVVRIKNVNNTGFDIRIQEWAYLNVSHAFETVGYIVMERGSYTLGNGAKVKAGSFNTDKTGSFGWVDFSEIFNQAPVIATSVISFNEQDAVCCRLRNIDTTGFDFCMQEQELNFQSHASETIFYIAWEPSSGTIDDTLTFEVNRTGDIMQDVFQTISFDQIFMSTPVFIADIQTGYDMDTANLRWETKEIDSVDVKIDEEQSEDSEIRHTTEVVGYMIFAPITIVPSPPTNLKIVGWALPAN
jgi:PKD repeat protein